MKLYRFRYSPYARKVQMLLDLAAQAYDCVEVSYSDRSELAKVTGGYIYVPVLVGDDGAVTVESRDICEKLVKGDAGRRLVPAPFEGPIWAYHDFADGPLEDVLFRIASPVVRDRWESPGDRALYVLIKERKFGAGCVTAWEKNRAELMARGRHLLGPSLTTLDAQPFLFGKSPTLADAALYGVGAMLEAADPHLVEQLSPKFGAFMRRLEAARPGA
ncbi:MAG TPA: glutathione S-transferase family protein [Polyangiaceae bacterium]|nr:glutathione S-transferase family protein [Polyangiaceae bacterium]